MSEPRRYCPNVCGNDTATGEYVDFTMTRLCPNPDLSCDACVDAFMDEHPGAEAWGHTFHACGCPWIAAPFDDGDDVCVGCRERRDLSAEFRHVMRGRAA